MDGWRGWALVGLASCCYMEGELEPARELLEEALPLLRNAGHARHELDTLLYLGHNYQESGDPTRAAEIWQQARKLALASGNPGRLAYIDVCLGANAFDQGKDVLAERSLEDALAVLGPEGDVHMQATTRLLLAKLALRQRKLRRAARLTRESLAAFRALANEPALVEALAITAALIAEGGESACAARLLGATATFAAALESPLQSYEQALTDETQKAVRETLEPDGFDAAFAAGQAYELEGAVDEALRALNQFAA
jgi:tetratricopeptide (TPR) repeat protein